MPGSGFFSAQSAKLSSNGINYPSHEKQMLAMWHLKKQKHNLKYYFDIIFKLKITLHNNFFEYIIFIPSQVVLTQNVISQLLKTLILCLYFNLFPLTMTLLKTYFWG